MNELALFQGIGGCVLAAQLLGHRIVCGVECEPYCNETILRRQEEGHLAPYPIWDNVRTFDGKPWRGKVDILSAGFPCQPFSVAGQRKGASDKRNLWPETLRIIRKVGCEWAFLENVPGLLSLPYWGTILGQMAEAGFDAEWMVLGADDCGANHRRKRLWILAHASGGRRDERTYQGVSQNDTAYVPYTDQERLPERQAISGRPGGPSTRQPRDSAPGAGWWDIEPGLGRVAPGSTYRVDRLKALGNLQVPIVAARAFRILMERY